MEIKVNRTNEVSNNTNDFGRTKSNENYECAFCHKKFNSPVERMKHEQKCYATTKIQEEQRKAEEHKRLAEADNERIQKEYDRLINDIKHHYNTYKESVMLDTSKGKQINNPYYIHEHKSHDSFSDFCKEFNAAFNRDYF